MNGWEIYVIILKSRPKWINLNDKKANELIKLQNGLSNKFYGKY